MNYPCTVLGDLFQEIRTFLCFHVSSAIVFFHGYLEQPQNMFHVIEILSLPLQQFNLLHVKDIFCEELL